MTKLDEAKITSQGQVSIPKKVREKLHVRAGDKVVFYEDEYGQIVLKEVESSIDFSPEEWDAFLAKTRKEPVTRVKGKAAAMRHLGRLSKK